MEQSNSQSVLRCKECNKPFDKESTLKRHGYYCRSRRVGVSLRPRSCIACAKAKARCDNKQPECSRCLSRSVRCRYPIDTRERERQQIQSNRDMTTVHQVSPSVADQFVGGIFQNLDDTNDISLDSVFDTAYSDFSNFGKDPFGMSANFTDFLTPPRYDKVEWSPLVYTSMPPDQEIQAQQVGYFPGPLIPATPNYAVRSFSKRPKLNPSAQRISRLILHTLKSYPLMMMRDNNLPPFIHPQLTASGVKSQEIEFLTNCINLVQMLGGRAYGSQKLFWKNVRMECERLCAEHMQLQKWELLAATQALSIYLLIRLDEGETEHNNVDAALVKTIIAIATRFNTIDVDLMSNTSVSPYKHGSKSIWKDWLLKESARRLCIVYQIVNMIVYFEPAALCEIHDNDLLLAPLPAKKSLWQAGDETSWTAEKSRHPKELDTIFGLAANGDLVKVHGDDQCGSDASALHYSSLENRVRSTVEWEEWCSGMDEMGGLVMLAASLIS